MKAKRKSKTRAARSCAPSPGSAIPAPKILRAEAARLDVLRHAMPEKAQGLMAAQVWAFNMCAAYLDSLGAPERLVRYLPAESPNGMDEGRRTQDIEDTTDRL